VKKKPIEFQGEGGNPLKGEVWLPDGPGPFACVLTAAQATRGATGSTARLAEMLNDVGIAMFVTNVRNFEEALSKGVAFDQDAEIEIRDHRHAITVLADQPEIDPSRIGFFGHSIRGGEAIILAAKDRRVSLVVAGVPLISGSDLARRWYTPDEKAKKYEEFAADRLDILHGEAPATIRLAPDSVDDKRPAYIHTKDYIEFFQKTVKAGLASPEFMTQRSHESLFDLEPGLYLPLISPTPLLMIVAEDDRENFTQSQMHAYETAGQPKRLVITKGNHFDIHFGQPFEQMSREIVDWCLRWWGTENDGRTGDDSE
jgi:fermentation-respiration switch protein FrsA (DUF1100 family)